MVEGHSVVIADAVRVWGGAERFVVDAACGLRARGWDVTVLAYPDRPLHRRAHAAGLDVHTVRTRANGAPWTVLPLMAWFARRRPDCVLSVYDKDLRTAAWAARMARPSTAILHSRECDEGLKDRPWIRFFHTHVADRILVNSEATRRTTQESAPWLDAARLAVVPKGVEIPSDRPQRAPGPVRIGFAGQLIDRKRVDVLIDAVAALGSPAVLHVAGEGPRRDALQARVPAGVDVRFDGFVHDMAAWYRSVDVFVLPSLVEGWGYVVAEAAAAGCAVLAHASSSIPEVVPAQAGAVLAAPDGSLAGALAALVAEGPEAWARRGRSLQDHARARLGLDRMVSNLENELLTVLARRRDPH